MKMMAGTLRQARAGRTRRRLLKTPCGWDYITEPATRQLSSSVVGIAATSCQACPAQTAADAVVAAYLVCSSLGSHLQLGRAQRRILLPL